MQMKFEQEVVVRNKSEVVDKWRETVESSMVRQKLRVVLVRHLGQMMIMSSLVSESCLHLTSQKMAGPIFQISQHHLCYHLQT